MAGNFALKTDGFGGTLVVDPRSTPARPPARDPVRRQSAGGKVAAVMANDLVHDSWL